MAALVITPEIEMNARRIAEITGETPTEVVARALRARLAEVAAEPSPGPKKTTEEILAMIRSYNLPVNNDLSEAEILGLDEFGVPDQTTAQAGYIDHR